MIGGAEMSSGRFLLKVKEFPRIRTHNAVCDRSLASCDNSNKDGAIMMWHHRLGHICYIANNCFLVCK